jgi:hypothetical protein
MSQFEPTLPVLYRLLDVVAFLPLSLLEKGKHTSKVLVHHVCAAGR